MRINNLSEQIPAGYELLNDTPFHRYQRTWLIGHFDRKEQKQDKKGRSRRHRQD